eukprot:2262226-Pyramimonas_sp.AAC.1
MRAAVRPFCCKATRVPPRRCIGWAGARHWSCGHPISCHQSGTYAPRASLRSLAAARRTCLSEATAPAPPTLH